jgi:glycolate oxidase iron-sulfur subunit
MTYGYGFSPRHIPFILKSETLLSLESQILSLSDRCVKCGLCLPHCPTYRFSLNENESPRGRISLMQGLASAQLTLSPTLTSHLDRCLDCRNCERVCPAGVEYETLLDTTRHWLNQQPNNPPVPVRQQQAINILSRPHRLRRINKLLRLYQLTGLAWLLRKTGIIRLLGLGYLASLLPRLRPVRNFTSIAVESNPRGRVALFTGCLGSTLEQSTIQASLDILQRLEYAVDLVTGQTCCGALARHGGETDMALALAQQNLQAFDPAQVDAILYTSSGCGAHLIKYPELPWPQASQQANASAFSSKLQEITAFLAQLEWPEHVRFRSSSMRIAVHEPCSQKNGLRQANLATELLRKIPGLQTETLPGNDRCCGAGGSYMLDHPQMAQALRAEKLHTLAQLAPDSLVTTNPGCALFLNAGLGHRSAIKVVHPVTILAAHLQTRNTGQT